MKSKFNLLSSVIALAVLSACGGGGGSTAPATVTATVTDPATATDPAKVTVTDNTTPALASANTEPVVVAPAAVAVISHKWCWSMQADQLRGTFITNQTVPGDGTAFLGTYTLHDISVYQSSFPEIAVGSISSGTYSFGTQPPYQIEWDGVTVTAYTRSNGELDNGFPTETGATGSGAYIIFSLEGQKAQTSSYGRVIFSSATPPSLSPSGLTGKCPGEV